MELDGQFVDISPDKDEGILKKLIKEGSDDGHPINGVKVFVHYTGTFYGGDKDGEKFDSSRDRGEQFSFTLGEGQVIKAWDIGVATMKKNEICELICKPAYAYGDKATGSIPANSTLKFEIELFSWQGKDISPHKDGSIIQTIIVQGTGYDLPKECVPVKISIKGTYEDNVFDERDVEFEIGDCASNNLIAGIEIAVKKMKKAERSKFDIEAQYAFGKAGNKDWNIPENATVSYEIHLKEFEKIKESFSLDSAQDKLQFTEDFKTRATERFQGGNIAYASKLYEKAMSYIEYDSDFKEEEKVIRNNLVLSLKLNLALCYLKQEDHVRAITECDKALDIDPLNEKGLYRKGQALMLRGDYEEAKRVFQKLLSSSPTNKQAVNQIRSCDLKIREHLDSEKKLYQSMFAHAGKGFSSGDSAKETADVQQQQQQRNAEESVGAQ